jgi:hypothetical protein
MPEVVPYSEHTTPILSDESLATPEQIQTLFTVTTKVIDYCVSPFADIQGNLPSGTTLASCAIKSGTFDEPFTITVEPVDSSPFNTSYAADLDGEGLIQPMSLLLSETVTDPALPGQLRAEALDPDTSEYAPASKAAAQVLQSAMQSAVDTQIIPKHVTVTFKQNVYTRPETLEQALFRQIEG